MVVEKRTIHIWVEATNSAFRLKPERLLSYLWWLGACTAHYLKTEARPCLVESSGRIQTEQWPAQMTAILRLKKASIKETINPGNYEIMSSIFIRVVEEL